MLQLSEKETERRICSNYFTVLSNEVGCPAIYTLQGHVFI